MSLINTMLKDLESRGHHGVPAANPYAASAPYPPRPAARWNAWTATQTVLTVAVAGAAGWGAAQWAQKPAALAVATAADPAAQVLSAVASHQATPPLVRSQPVPADLVEEPAAVQAGPVPAAQPVATAPPAGMSEPKTRVAKAPVERTPTVAAVARANEPAAVKVAAATPRTAASGPAASVASSAKAPSQPNAAADDTAARAERTYQEGLSQLGLGQADPAIKSLQDALALWPRHVKARLTLARLLNERKQSSQAANLLADGLMLLPQQTDFVLALAPLWIQAGQENDAMALLAQGTRHANGNSAFHGYYATQLLRLKRHADAVASYRIALRGEPGQHEWWLGLGLALQATGQTQEAVNAFTQALSTGKLSAQNKSMVEQLIAKMKVQTP